MKKNKEYEYFIIEIIGFYYRNKEYEYFIIGIKNMNILL